jgi:hypothetical protein
MKEEGSMMRRRLLLATILAVTSLLLFALPMLAQEEDTEDAPTLEYIPAESIIPGPIEVTDFNPDGTAILEITSTVDVACSIVYGETTDFGQIATDTDMAGGAHSDHMPLLTGLAPETTYYYRIQGFDADGNLYVSETMSFTTPAFDTSEIDNLASILAGAEVIGYSSIFGDGEVDSTWGPNSAFDGNLSTAWSSDGDGDDAWVEVQLAQPAHVNSIEFQSRSMTDGTSRVLSFMVTTDTGDEYGPFELDEAGGTQQFDVDFEAETLRFDVVESTGGNTGAVDIAVYGDPLEEE